MAVSYADLKVLETFEWIAANFAVARTGLVQAAQTPLDYQHTEAEASHEM